MSVPLSVSVSVFLSWLLIITVSIFPANGLVNVFLPKWEMFSLVGLNAELYYLHEGKVNDYALGFQMPVPPEISQMHFAWKRLIPEPIPYSIALRHLNDMSALKTPTINITKKGMVPTQESVFCITLECTGYKTAEVNVEIIVNVTYAGDTTSLVLKRKKICLQHIMEPTPLPGVVPPPQFPSPNHNQHQTVHDSTYGQGQGPPMPNQYNNNAYPPIDQTSPYIPQGGEVIDNNDQYDHSGTNSRSMGAEMMNPVGSVRSPSPATQSALYIILGSLVGIVLIVVLLSLVCFIRSKPNSMPSPAYSDCTATLTLPKHGAHGTLTASYGQNPHAAYQYQTMIAQTNATGGNGNSNPHCPIQFQSNDRSSSANSSTVVNPLMFKSAGAGGKKSSLLQPFSSLLPPPVPTNPPNSLPIYGSALFNSLQRRQNHMGGNENALAGRNVFMGVSSPSSHLYENPSPLEPLNYIPASAGNGMANMNIMTGTLMSRASDSLAGANAAGNGSSGSARGSSCAGDPHFL